MHDVLLRGGTAVLETGCQQVDIGVDDGKITALYLPNSGADAERTVNCSGKMIFPGAIDTHGHMLFREDFHIGTMNAAKGGVTTVVEMPLCNQRENRDNTLTPELFEQKIACGSNEAHVDFALWGGLTRGTLDQIEALHAAGCVGFKAFISFAGEDYPYLDDYALWLGMQKIKALGSVIAVHAENESICAALTRKFRMENKGAAFFEPSRPVIAEAEAAGRAAFFARKTGCKTIICHVSCAEVLDEILRQRDGAKNIFAETCPHYLTLDATDIVRCGGFAKCSPPLRTCGEAAKLWERIDRGEIWVIGADHSGYGAEEKDTDIWSASGGFVGLDLFLPALVSEGMHQHGISPQKIAQISAGNAAKTLGLYPQKGCIAVGSDADFAVVDPGQNWTFHAKDSFYLEKDPRYPYEGRTFTGNVTMTIVRGRIVYEDGVILAPKGYGVFVHPKA